MVLSPCIAIRSKIRFIAHLTGNLAEVFPYLNAELPTVFYNANAPSVYFKEEYRAISLYPQRIAAGKADEIVDAWRILEVVRCQVNEIWARRDCIKPSYAMREKPSVLDILKRLPGTNCGQCGEKTCLAFAARIWSGTSAPRQCQPIYGGDFGHLREELAGICMGVSLE
jgi:ArsR family metal-binding transcriptional regulator